MGELVLDVGLAAKLKVAFGRNGWNVAQIDRLCEGETLGQFRKVLLGTASIIDNPAPKEAVVKGPRLLKPDGHYSAIELGQRHDPDVFGRSRPVLEVHGDFRSRIVAMAKPTEAGATFKKLPRFKLGQNATGKAMKLAPPKSVWMATEFCPWLAVKITKQPSGEKGELLHNGWANLFLVEGLNSEVFVVYVRWSVGRWHVSAWQLDVGWNAGNRFGSRN